VKYLDEYRDDAIARALLDDIARTVTRHWTLMEVCGGQTHTLIRQGIDQLLPPQVELVHGPGCPVCVTPLALIDEAIAIAKRPDAIVCSFGDMLRVPGSTEDLFMARAAGGDVRVVYSPLDALEIARRNPNKTVVFFAVGFETTAPANAMAAKQAHDLGIENFALLVAHVLVPPAILAILAAPGNRVQGFLAPGHVCAIQGWTEYEPIARDYRVPLAVTGFEPLDLLEGIRMLVLQLEEGRFEVENQYVRTVVREGNVAARRVVEEVFETCDRAWRGLGVIASSGLRLREPYRMHDAEARFPRPDGVPASESEICIAARCSAAAPGRTSARRSARSVRPSRRSARRWSPARARAPRTSWPAGRARRSRHERGSSRVRAPVPSTAAAGRQGPARARQRGQALGEPDPRRVRAGVRRLRARAAG
jgi:hydrogenase expression/formation protein HypD